MSSNTWRTTSAESGFIDKEKDKRTDASPIYDPSLEIVDEFALYNRDSHLLLSDGSVPIRNISVQLRLAHRY